MPIEANIIHPVGISELTVLITSAMCFSYLIYEGLEEAIVWNCWPTRR